MGLAGQRVKVGALDYAIFEVGPLVIEGELSSGYVDHLNCIIQLEANQSLQSKRVTLWHELLHAILVQAGIKEHDERALEVLAYGIVGVLRDNPRLSEI